MAEIDDIKICTKCKKAHLRAAFYKDMQKTDGLSSSCRKCNSEARKGYKRPNPQKPRTAAQLWKYTKAWRERNKEAHLAKRREWSRSDQGKESGRRWVALNREAVNLCNRVRNAMRRGMRRKVTVERVSALLQLQKCLCAVCRADLKFGYHIDHIHPISGGGNSDPLNLQLLCPTCNCSKGPKHPVDFMQRKGYLL